MSAAEKDINTALSVRLKAFQTAGEPPIAYENTPYEPTEGSLYLQEAFLPNIKAIVGVSHASSDDYEGIYQITVADGRGDRRFDAQEQARLLSLHFPRGAEYTYNGVTVKIVQTRVNGAVIEDNWYNIPVTVEWRAFA
jgi:hypothetical protein